MTNRSKNAATWSIDSSKTLFRKLIQIREWVGIEELRARTDWAILSIYIYNLSVEQC